MERYLKSAASPSARILNLSVLGEPDVIVHGDRDDPEEAAKRIIDALLSRRKDLAE